MLRHSTVRTRQRDRRRELMVQFVNLDIQPLRVHRAVNDKESDLLTQQAEEVRPCCRPQSWEVTARIQGVEVRPSERQGKRNEQLIPNNNDTDSPVLCPTNLLWLDLELAHILVQS